MAATMYSFINAIPALTSRVYPGTAPVVPATPYAITWDKQGGVVQALYGLSDIMVVYPCVTVYDKPQAGETAQHAQVRLRNLITALQGAPRAIDTHSDGVTPYIVGSVSRVLEPVVMDDDLVQGQVMATMQLRALIYRQ